MKLTALRVTGLFVLTALLVPAATNAEPIILDWDTAWEYALERNETLANAKDEVVRARHRVGEAWSAALPSVNMMGAYQHYFQVPSTIFHLPASMSPNGQSLRIKTQFGSENNVVGNIELQQPLYVGGKIGLGLRLARQFQELTELNVQVSREDLRVSLTAVFYGAMLADEAVSLSHEVLEQMQTYHEQVKEMYEQGVVSEYDLVRVEVQVASARPMIIEAETGRDLAYKALKNLIGIDVDEEIIIRGELNEFEPIGMEYEEANSLAMRQRIEFQLLNLQKKLYEGQEEAEKRSLLWPNLFAGLKWETMAQADNYKFNKYEFLNGFGGSVALQVPLFDGMRSHHRAQQARVSIRNVQRQQSLLERGVKLQTFKATQDIKKAAEYLVAARETLALAEKGYRIAEVRYSNGVGTQLEVLDAHRIVSSSKLEVLSALFNQKVARAEFDRAVGLHFQVD